MMAFPYVDCMVEGPGSSDNHTHVVYCGGAVGAADIARIYEN